MPKTRGKAKTLAFSQSGSVVEGNKEGESWNFIYEASTVKHPNFNVGDRVQLPDGRVFRYAKSGAACWSGRGNVFFNAVPTVGIDYKVLTENAAIGDNSVKTLAIVTHTEDDLRGGHALLKVTNTAPDSALQMRLITGNSAAAIGAEMTIYLDGGLNVALTTSSYIVAMPSPWSDIRYSSDGGTPAVGVEGRCSHAGIAATYVSAANMYFWCQTWGECWICPISPVGETTHEREVVWRYDGSVQRRGTGAVDGLRQQSAGFILDYNLGDNGLTKMMLQVCP